MLERTFLVRYPPLLGVQDSPSSRPVLGRCGVGRGGIEVGGPPVPRGSLKRGFIGSLTQVGPTNETISESQEWTFYQHRKTDRCRREYKQVL